MSLTIEKWPAVLTPNQAIVLAPQHVRDGELSRAGYINGTPIMGARNQVRMSFSYIPATSGHWYAWALNCARGTAFEVPVFCSPQLAGFGESTLNGPANAPDSVPFHPNTPFSGGQGFAYEPLSSLGVAVQAGSTYCEFPTVGFENKLKPGKVFGIGGFCHHVHRIDEKGGYAKVWFRIPARRDYGTGDQVTLRPTVLCQPADATSFISLFEPGGLVRPSSITLNEVIHDQLLTSP